MHLKTCTKKRLTQTQIYSKNGWCESNWLADLLLTGEYVLMVETAGQHFKGTAFVQLFNDDHRCTTIVPPMREEILVTFGQVISRTAEIEAEKEAPTQCHTALCMS